MGPSPAQHKIVDRTRRGLVEGGRDAWWNGDAEAVPESGYILGHGHHLVTSDAHLDNPAIGDQVGQHRIEVEFGATARSQLGHREGARRSQQVKQLLGSGCPPLDGEALQVGLDFGDHVGIEQVGEAVLAEQFGQQRGVQRQSRSLLLQPVAHRPHRRRHRRSRRAATWRTVMAPGLDVDHPNGPRRDLREVSCSPARSKTSVRHSRIVSSTMGNSGYCAATVSSWADRIRCCHRGDRDFGSRRGSSSARAALSRKRAANRADPPTSSVTTASRRSGSHMISSAVGGSDSVSGIRSTMPSLVAVAWTSMP